MLHFRRQAKSRRSPLLALPCTLPKDGPRGWSRVGAGRRRRKPLSFGAHERRGAQTGQLPRHSCVSPQNRPALGAGLNSGGLRPSPPLGIGAARSRGVGRAAGEVWRAQSHERTTHAVEKCSFRSPTYNSHKYRRQVFVRYPYGSVNLLVNPWLTACVSCLVHGLC